MSHAFDLIESDIWPILRQKVAEKRAECLQDLLNVATIETMRHEQGFIHALDWVLDQAKPVPPPVEQQEDIY